MEDTINVNDEIYNCLDLDNPKSFFLFAGAGSGKTRSLVDVLTKFRENNSYRLRVNGQQIAIITYTNAACDEIKRRLEFDPIFNVSTIHSFSWDLIKYYHHDIKEWLRTKLNYEIEELVQAQEKGRAGTKASEDRPKQISAKRERVKSLNAVKVFTYNPNGENSGKDSLNHSEVIGITADFLSKETLLKKILVKKYPILFVDECQDTKKELIDALFLTQNEMKEEFCLGFFGDTMQRIYSDGKEDLGVLPLPDNWLTPQKIYNYRSPRRVVKLINKIREDVDGNLQHAKKNSEGIVRLFIINTKESFNKSEVEECICQKMADITQDTLWKNSKNNKTLILEHHMAAQRGGFHNFFEPLYNVEKIRTSLLDGTSSNITFFIDKIIPLINYLNAGNQFAVSRIISKYSPLMEKERIKNSQNPVEEIKKVRESIDALYALWDKNKQPILLDIIKEVYKSGVFILPETLKTIAGRENEIYEFGDNADPIIDAWDKALLSNFQDFNSYVSYISEQSKFGTHQGVKGLEFPRVMVILDDIQARGFLFSYDKLFGVKELSSKDIQNRAIGKDSSFDRTKRLFYVTCSRAEDSLAILAYTDNPERLKSNVLGQEWFSEDEIVFYSN